MGLLIDGVWHDEEPKKRTEDSGKFKRVESIFRNWVTQDGAPGPSGDGGFQGAANRYHLYVSHSCPWAHRTVIMRKLKGLENLIGLSVTNWHSVGNGWTFKDAPGVVQDPINNAEFVYQIYTAADPDYTGRVTVPVLWDNERKTIVNNESSEIIRMFNSGFDSLNDPEIRRDLDFYPTELSAEIDAVNDEIYSNVNNGVYRSGFAKSQDAYEEAVTALFETLERMEERLGRQRYLVGDQITEADWRLFTTLVRFDLVYYSHFKCNIRRLADYPNLQNYLLELYQIPGIAETVDFTHIKGHYYGSQLSVNPTGIVPVGPTLDFTVAHDRERLAAAAP
jgi:putative glutathione S-transferase